MKRLLLLLIPLAVSCHSGKKESASYAGNAVPQSKVSIPKECFIKGNDTVAILSKVNYDGQYSNIITKKIYKERDKEAIDEIVKSFAGTISAGHSIFFYLDNDEPEESWYGSYYKGRFGSKMIDRELSDEALKENLAMMKADIAQTGIDFVRLFLAKKDMFEETVKRYERKELNEGYRRFLVKNFPKARNEYFKHAKQKLWEKDIEVSMVGKDIKFYGYMFASNRVIKETYEEIALELEKLRFRRCCFGWIEGETDYYYTVSEKKDSDI